MIALAPAIKLAAWASVSFLALRKASTWLMNASIWFTAAPVLPLARLFFALSSFTLRAFALPWLSTPSVWSCATKPIRLPMLLVGRKHRDDERVFDVQSADIRRPDRDRGRAAHVRLVVQGQRVADQHGGDQRGIRIAAHAQRQRIARVGVSEHARKVKYRVGLVFVRRHVRDRTDHRRRHVGDPDRKAGGRDSASRVAGLHGDRMARGGVEVEQRAVAHGDDSGARVDGEAAARAVGQAVSDRIAIRVTGECGNAHGRATGGAFGHAVGRSVRIDRSARRQVVREFDDEDVSAGTLVRLLVPGPGSKSAVPEKTPVVYTLPEPSTAMA